MASSRPTSSRLTIKSKFLKTFGCQQQTMSTCPKHGTRPRPRLWTRPTVSRSRRPVLGLGSLSLLRSPLRKINEIFMRKFVNFFSGLSCVAFILSPLCPCSGDNTKGLSYTILGPSIAVAQDTSYSFFYSWAHKNNTNENNKNTNWKENKTLSAVVVWAGVVVGLRLPPLPLNLRLDPGIKINILFYTLPRRAPDATQI